MDLQNRITKLQLEIRELELENLNYKIRSRQISQKNLNLIKLMIIKTWVSDKTTCSYT